MKSAMALKLTNFVSDLGRARDEQPLMSAGMLVHHEEFPAALALHEAAPGVVLVQQEATLAAFAQHAVTPGVSA